MQIIINSIKNITKTVTLTFRLQLDRMSSLFNHFLFNKCFMRIHKFLFFGFFFVKFCKQINFVKFQRFYFSGGFHTNLSENIFRFKLLIFFFFSIIGINTKF